jgi:low temperature requirement protein LtrA
MSRLLLGIQYFIVLLFALRSKAKKLFLPLVLCLASFFASAAIFFLMTMAFRDESGHTNRAIYAVWWVVMLIEALVVITVSCKWRMLSFKATHLVERMGLLTLIVIGEGAIGVTKTVGKIMGKKGPDLEGAMLICCIVLVLVSIIAAYISFQRGNTNLGSRSSFGCSILIISQSNTMELSDSRYGALSTFYFTLQ